MNNVDTLIAAGIIPQNHTLTSADMAAINDLSTDEVNTIISLKTKLGGDFLQRNRANCLL